MLRTVDYVSRRALIGADLLLSGRCLYGVTLRCQRRHVSSSSANHDRAGRNVLARYTSPNRRFDIPQPRDKDSLQSTSPSTPYETIATSPAGPTLQDVPPPGDQPTTRKAIPIPAEKPIESDPAGAPGSFQAKTSPQPARETYIQGVLVPPKPRPPGEEECCMSGCVHCVYTIYADELEEYTSALKAARDALVKAGTPAEDWPEAVKQVDEQGAEGMARAEEKKVENAVDPSLAAFLALESRLNKK